MTDLPVSIVDLGRLDWTDQRFVIRSFLPSHRLQSSLDRYGILQPPWLWLRNDGRYAIVDGFNRLAWARDSRKAAERCMVFPVEFDPRDIMLRRVEGKIFGADLNVAEKARIIFALAEILASELIAEKYFPALGVASRPESVESWRVLAGADDDLLDAAACDRISERSALDLAGWEEGERNAALFILEKLRCSSSIQKEILERFTEVAMALDRQRLEVLLHPEVSAILNHPDWNHRQKTRGLRDLLTRWRFPRLSARESRFTREMSSASLPKAIRVVPPPAFEGENWQLVLSFSDPEGLRDTLHKAMEFIASGRLQNLMHPGGPDGEAKP
jgi:ParB family chromosome partitioning protein